jgi:regulator of replication initiation timing
MAQTDTEKSNHPVSSLEEIQQEWHDLASRVDQLETERNALEQENKSLRSLLEKAIEHRQKSHGELVNLIAGLVSKLPINDVSVVVSKLVEHNAHVSEVCAALANGKIEGNVLQPAILKALEQTKRDLIAAIKPTVEELIRLDTPLETKMLQTLVAEPESFFSSEVVRANRCFVKGQMPRERVVREFGEPALAFFNDLTTDAKLNPHPKPEEIVMGFKNDFEALLRQDSALPADKRKELLALYRKVQRSKASSAEAQAQKNAFLKLSFVLELLHYYNNQSTESPEGTFAQRLPAVIEQLVVTNDQDNLDEKLIKQAESLLAFVAGHDQRQMVVNNIGKGGRAGRTLKFVLMLRMEKVPELDGVIATLVKHLIPNQKAPPPQSVAAVLRLIKPVLQTQVVKAIMTSTRIRKNEAEALGLAVGQELGLKGLEAELTKPDITVSPEQEQQMAWDNIKARILQRTSPNDIAAAIRDRLHAKYDADEVKQSWLALTEAEPIVLVRIFCLLPYLPDGQTDPIAQAVMESYVSRLMHEKYADTYTKVVHALQNLFKVKPDSPALVNFIALVKWVNAEAAAKLSHDIGMAAPTK